MDLSLVAILKNICLPFLTHSSLEFVRDKFLKMNVVSEFYTPSAWKVGGQEDQKFKLHETLSKNK